MKNTFLIICILLSLYLSIFSFYKIDLATADIGRHITNGKIFLNSEEYGISKWQVLHTNLFSYTYPSFTFVNHHWFSGIVIYLLFTLFGFSALSIIYFLLVLGAFLFSLSTTNKTDWSSIFFTGLFLVPLLADRTEVRPEGLSYLLLAIFIFILYKFSSDKLSHKFLWILPFLSLLWANTHIYFIFGIFITGVFLFESVILKQFEKIKKIGVILFTSLIATAITPYGISGIIYPFVMFQNYGYRIVENQSIRFLENLSFNNPSFLWYKILLALIVISSIIILVYKRKKFLIALTLISLTFAILAYLGIRHIAAFALVSLPLLTYNISLLKEDFEWKIEKKIKIILYIILFLIITICTFFHFLNKLAWNRNFGIGIESGGLSSTKFILENQISGPIFNNYDIGGLMIFSLFPKEKVFVDNRPEGYPKEFFEKVYIPMQEDDMVWNTELKKENFNVIYFYRLDYTPWAQSFLIRRISDPLWAPVYVDDKTIIFLKRSDQNKKIIDRYELPKSLFIVK